MKAARRTRLAAAAALLCLLLAGCGPAEDLHDLEEFVSNSGYGMRGKIEPPPDVDSAPPVHYAGTGRQPQPFDPARIAGQ